MIEEKHFFESLVNALIRVVGARPFLLVAALMIAGAASAALVDEAEKERTPDRDCTGLSTSQRSPRRDSGEGDG